MAEVSGSSERTFYLDWWNSATMEQFWRQWNLPVHRWCVQHIYLPLVSRGGAKLTGVMVTFLFSAVLHEYLISGMQSTQNSMSSWLNYIMISSMHAFFPVPICICGHFAFVTFLSQGVFCKVSSLWTKKFGPTAGNILVRVQYSSELVDILNCRCGSPWYLVTQLVLSLTTIMLFSLCIKSKV